MTKKVLEDEGFHCTPDFAVKVAHVMSCATACYDDDSAGVTDVLEEYMRGLIDEDQAIATFHAEWPSVFPDITARNVEIAAILTDVSAILREKGQ